jgi:hypothetical protein
VHIGMVYVVHHTRRLSATACLEDKYFSTASFTHCQTDTQARSCAVVWFWSFAVTLHILCVRCIIRSFIRFYSLFCALFASASLLRISASYTWWWLALPCVQNLSVLSIIVHYIAGHRDPGSVAGGRVCGHPGGRARRYRDGGCSGREKASEGFAQVLGSEAGPQLRGHNRFKSELGEISARMARPPSRWGQISWVAERVWRWEEC